MIAEQGYSLVIHYFYGLCMLYTLSIYAYNALLKLDTSISYRRCLEKSSHSQLSAAAASITNFSALTGSLALCCPATI